MVVDVVDLNVPIFCDVKGGAEVYVEIFVLQVVGVALCNLRYRLTQVVAKLVVHALGHEAAPTVDVKPWVGNGGSYAWITLVTVRVESAATHGYILVDF